MHETLSANELDHLWALVPERRRLAFIGSLSEEASQVLLAYQLRRRRGIQAQGEATSQRDQNNTKNAPA